ncbi:hypothetical protein KR026_010633 [Drosophila bipectinata]|nr:hypothetical protein KR026_010633 [Drosophila bipectinata]
MTDKVPEWFSAEVFEDVLRTNVDGFVKVKSFKPEMGSGAGDNYATIMLRVKIEVELKDGKEKEVSYMVKLPHQLDIYKEMIKNSNIFDTERFMYNDVVPEMEEMYRKVGVDITFGAKAYDLKNAQSDYVALEDLGQKGFKNANRLEGLDQAHTERVLKKLAQWHAASVVRVATKGPYPQARTMGMFNPNNRPIMKEISKGMGEKFLKCCTSFKGNEAYIEKVVQLVDRVFDLFSKVKTTEFNVLNHGDFWCNNVMFQYDDHGEIQEVYLIDFQFPNYGTVAQDLTNFLISSTKLEDKLSKFDHYIKVYHDNLVEHLKVLQYSKAPPSLRDIHKSLIRNGASGFAVAGGGMAAVLMEPTEDACLENFVGNGAEGVDLHSQMFKNPRYREHIEVVLPWLLNRGALDLD